MKIKLSTIRDVQEFVAICSKFHNDNIDVIQERYVVNGKSILGILSLNLLNDLEVVLNCKNKNSKIAKINFYNYIQKWKV